MPTYAPIKSNNTRKARLSAQFAAQRAQKKQELKLYPGTTEELINRMVDLAQFMSGKKLFPYQIEIVWGIIEAVLERRGDVLTALISRQGGKSESVSSAACPMVIVLPEYANMFPDDPRFSYKDEAGRTWGFQRGFDVGIFAPALQQAHITYERSRLIFQSDNAKKVLTAMGAECETSNGDTVKFVRRGKDGEIIWKSSIMSKTASKTANIEGHTFHLLITEETQDMDDMKIEKSLSPMLAATNGTMIHIGTANARKSSYYKAICRNRRLETSGEVDRKLHFYYPWRVVARYNKWYGKYVEKEMERLGPESDAFQMSYECRFLLERGMFITERILTSPKTGLGEGIFSKVYQPREVDRAIPSNYSIVAGIDFAKEIDSTVLTLVAVDWNNPEIDEWVQDLKNPYKDVHYRVYRKHVLGWLEIYGDDYESQFNDIISYLAPIKRLQKLRVDATGLGAPMFDRLCAALSGSGIILEPHIFSETSNSECYKALSSDMIQGRFTFPYGIEARKSREVRKFIVQFLDLQKTTKRGGILRVAAPEEQGAHDDFPDSALLACQCANVPANDDHIQEHSNIRVFR